MLQRIADRTRAWVCAACRADRVARQSRCARCGGAVWVSPAPETPAR